MSEVIYSEFRNQGKCWVLRNTMVIYRYMMTKWPAILSAVRPLRDQPILVNLCDFHKVYGDEWFSKGCISAHYQNMVVEGESVRAFVEMPAEEKGIVRIALRKKTERRF